MKLVTYVHEGVERVGAVRDDAVIDLSPIAPSMLALIDGGPALLARARDHVASATASTPLGAVTLRAPIPRPRKNIICLGMNYAAHAIESLRAKGLPEKLPEYPVFFTKAPTAVNHPGATVPLMPELSPQRDWEVELALVIGLPARKVPREEALGYVFGYTILNDVSARDLQSNHQQFFFSKSLDGSAPMGPWIVTGLDVSDLEVRCEVGEEVRQLGRTKDMVFDVPTLVSYVSHVMTLLPGDVLLTGTPAGVSPLVAGDTVTVRIEGIGELTNPVLALE